MIARFGNGVMRRGRCIALAAVFGAIGHGALAQVSVDELELHIALKRGATTATEVFHAANGTNLPAQATISLQDWDRSETGENRYYPLGTKPYSCGSRVKVFPTVLQLGPRTTQTVRVTVDSAASIGNGCYVILFVDNPTPPRTSNGPALLYSIRYGVKVYVEREMPLAAEVENMTIAKREEKGAKPDTSLKQAVIAFKNTGGRQTMTHGSLEIRRPDNSVVAKVDISEFPTLPGATRRLGVPIPRLPRGKYVLLALLDYEGSEIAAGQVDLEIP